MTGNDDALRSYLQPYVNKHYPSTFTNLLGMLKQTALSLEQELGLPEVKNQIEQPAVVPEETRSKQYELTKYSVDFEISMGKYDLYLKPFYEQCLVESLDYCRSRRFRWNHHAIFLIS